MRKKNTIFNSMTPILMFMYHFEFEKNEKVIITRSCESKCERKLSSANLFFMKFKFMIFKKNSVKSIRLQNIA